MMAAYMGIIILAALTAGCSRSSIPREIDCDIADICANFHNGTKMRVIEELSEKVSERIKSLNDANARRVCVDKWKASLLNIDPHDLDLESRGHFLRAMLDVDGLKRIMYEYEKAGASKDELIDVIIEFLQYVRRHTQCLIADIKKMPTGIEKGVIVDLDTNTAYLKACTGYGDVATAYEGDVLLLEYYQFHFMTNGLQSAVCDRMRQKFEDFLGRPMRTADECRRDHRNRKAVEFPRMDPLGRSKDASRRIAGKKSELEKKIPNVEVEVEFQKGE